MKKRYIFAIIFVFVLILSSVTNPSSKEGYAGWVKEQISEESGMFLGWLGGTVVKAGTSKKNLVLFTIYETKFGEKDDEKLVALGIFNRYIWLKGFEEEK